MEEEIERLAKIAYEAYMHDAYGHDGSRFYWEKLDYDHQQKHWIAAIKNILQAQQEVKSE